MHTCTLREALNVFWLILKVKLQNFEKEEVFSYPFLHACGDTYRIFGVQITEQLVTPRFYGIEMRTLLSPDSPSVLSSCLRVNLHHCKRQWGQLLYLEQLCTFLCFRINSCCQFVGNSRISVINHTVRVNRECYYEL